MPHNAAIHPGLHCWPNNPFGGFWSTKGKFIAYANHQSKLLDLESKGH